MLSREKGLHPIYRFGVQGSERVEQLPEVTEQAGMEGLTPISSAEVKVHRVGGASAAVTFQGEAWLVSPPGKGHPL